jgi:predicted Rossmann-fold nucleotide-binding protein
VILFGTAYWAGLVDWLKETVVREGKIAAPDLELFRLTDDPREAADIVIRAREERPAIPIAGEADFQYPDQ